MPKQQTIIKSDVVFCDAMLSTLLDLQDSDNDAINMYIDYLNRVSDLLFEKGNELEASESKNQLFEMLHYTHMLRKDLEALKAAKS